MNKLIEFLKITWSVITYPLFPIYAMGILWAFGLFGVAVMAMLGIPIPVK